MLTIVVKLIIITHLMGKLSHLSSTFHQNFAQNFSRVEHFNEIFIPENQ